MITRSKLVALVTILMIAIGLVGPSSPAAADPIYPKGCASHAVSFSGGVLYDWYGLDASIRYCWTGGTVAASRLYNVTGSAATWANVPANS